MIFAIPIRVLTFQEVKLIDPYEKIPGFINC